MTFVILFVELWWWMHLLGVLVQVDINSMLMITADLQR